MSQSPNGLKCGWKSRLRAEICFESALFFCFIVFDHKHLLLFWFLVNDAVLLRDTTHLEFWVYKWDNADIKTQAPADLMKLSCQRGQIIFVCEGPNWRATIIKVRLLCYQAHEQRSVFTFTWIFLLLYLMADFSTPPTLNVLHPIHKPPSHLVSFNNPNEDSVLVGTADVIWRLE